MSKPTPCPDGWTIKTYAIHAEAMRQADSRFDDERDRRYSEGAELRAVALKIKETADLAALTLARESQTLKEAQNDALRDKTLSESGVYATNSSVAAAIASLRLDLQPIFDFVSGSKATTVGSDRISGRVFALGAIVATLFGGMITALVIKLLGG